MNTNNLQVGQVLKNYKKFCEILEEPLKTGNSKMTQLKEWERYFEYHKDGVKYIIDEIFNTPKASINTTDNRYIEHKEFNIEYNKRNNKGIYYILSGNDIYIGSTINFRHRFRSHFLGDNGRMQITYDLLRNGGTFNILYDMTNIDDTILIRKTESEYIKYFDKSTKYNVINRMLKAKEPFENIKIKICEGDKRKILMEFLQTNNYI